MKESMNLMRNFFCASFLFVNAYISVAQNPCPPSEVQGEHIVQSGETLYGISKKYQTTVAQLCEWNNLQETGILHPCDKLKVEAPETAETPPTEQEVPTSYYIAALQPKGAPKNPTKNAEKKPTISKSDLYKSVHIVKAGETLSGIAVRYGYTITRLVAMNNLKDAQSIKVGQRIKLLECQSENPTEKNTPSVPPSVTEKKMPISSPKVAEKIPEKVSEKISEKPKTTPKVVEKATPASKNVVKEVAESVPTAYNNTNTPNYLYFQSSNYSPVVHIVAENETPASIAKLYGLTAGDVMMMNNLRDNSTLKPDQKLLLEDRNAPRKDNSTYLLSDTVITNLPFDSEQIKIPHAHNGASVNQTPTSEPVAVAPNVPTNQPKTEKSTPPPTADLTNVPPLSHTTSMNNEEIEMIKEINLIRQDPVAYIAHVEEYIKYLKSRGDFMGSSGTAAELIEELRKTSPLPLLEPKECIYAAAQKHGEDQRKKRDLGHKGSDGSNSWDRILRECSDLKDGGENLIGGQANIRRAVITLLVDHGIPDHLHRKTILNPDWKFIACRKLGTIGDMPHCWIQNFGY